MYENLPVYGPLWHVAFVLLNFGIWQRLVRFDKRDRLIPLVLLLGPMAFFLIVMGVFLRWFIIRTGIRQTFIAPSGKKTYWDYQVRFPFELFPGAVTWMGFWFGLLAVIYASVA